MIFKLVIVSHPLLIQYLLGSTLKVKAKIEGIASQESSVALALPG
jgi:hypothetical protein